MTFGMEPIGPHGQNVPFSRSNEPQIHHFFCYPKFRPHFSHNFLWTSVKTLAIEPVGPYGQKNPFSRSNEPQNRISTSFWLKFFMDIRLDISYEANLPSQPKRPIFKVKRASE
ncbi:hypothetical protein H5410_044070 [Solanum commersonii]|uniref:Uncharacterized protein n=1 Tax=Solanum commersonii TaxID=4109 RepID=A0A9J5Y2N1_SOLCO|nr:hypothetical protein H5410_044070 [Solanum commersonii]